MTFQAYLDTVKAKTGLGPEEFKALAAEKGLTKHSEIIKWLKEDYGLGHGHANAIAHVITSDDKPKVSADEKIDAHFKGGKAHWRTAYDALMTQIGGFGPDVRTAPTSSYISLLRGDGKFGIVAVTADRLDIGVKLKGAAAEGRLEPAGAWNAMVTHRVRVSDPAQIDAELIGWLHQAYDAA